jgi:DNA polymerase III subunit epsilon
MYAIVDIETTGGSPRYEKITEIAIMIHDGEKIVDEFVTLINPEKNIPYFITNLTGITNEMVADAPKFYEVARKIVELTDNKIFVAHNVNFDYNFIRSEFQNLGYNFIRELLCTVKLSRKLIPGRKSYSLGNICSDLGIKIKDRHRAEGDAMATTRLLELLIEKRKQSGITEIDKTDLGVLHPLLDKQKIMNLPEETGVYYLYNEKKDLIYTGKSRNIKARILTHLGASKGKTALKMRSEIADVSYELTGNELVALLLESDEIKKHKPLYNRSQRYSRKNYGICYYLNDQGYICLEIKEVNCMDVELLCSFESREYAVDFLNTLVDNYTLCQKLTGVYKSQNACFHYEIRQCKGACIGVEKPEEYNSRAQMALQSLQVTNENMLIIDKGRNIDEKTIVAVKNGKYLGYGFFDYSEIKDIDSLYECIIKRKDNHEVRQIIRNYLKKNKVERIIR